MKKHIIRNRTITPMLALTTVVALSLSVISPSFAVTGTIISSNFSLGYGVIQNGTQAQQWSDSETSSANTNVNSPFSLSVVFSSRTPAADDDSYDGAGSFQGPTFPNRVLSDGDTTTTISGWAPRFQVALNGSWTGATPLDATPNPNYQFSLEITSIRIYGNLSAYGDATHTSMWFSEVTAGHGSSMSPFVVSRTTPILAATNWTQLVWNPNDFSDPGTTGSRTFWVNADTTGSHAFIDGFEVFGDLVVTYDAIPEPATIALLSIGGLAVVLRRRTP